MECQSCGRDLNEMHPGIDNGGYWFCDEDCSQIYQEARELGIAEPILEDLPDDIPFIHYRIQPLPHIVLDPCPSCQTVLELAGSAIKSTPLDGFIMRSLAGKKFKLQCPNCEAILQVEKPLLVEPGNVSPMNRAARRALDKQFN